MFRTCCIDFNFQCDTFENCGKSTKMNLLRQKDPKVDEKIQENKTK